MSESGHQQSSTRAARSRFIRDYPLASALLVFGAAFTVLARVNEAYDLIKAGLPSFAWEAIGLTLFFCTFIAVLVSWYQSQVSRQSS